MAAYRVKTSIANNRQIECVALTVLPDYTASHSFSFKSLFCNIFRHTFLGHPALSPLRLGLATDLQYDGKIAHTRRNNDTGGWENAWEPQTQRADMGVQGYSGHRRSFYSTDVLDSLRFLT